MTDAFRNRTQTDIFMNMVCSGTRCLSEDEVWGLVRLNEADMIGLVLCPKDTHAAKKCLTGAISDYT